MVHTEEWLCKPLVPALGRQNLAALYEFEANLIYRASFRTSRATMYQKEKEQKEKWFCLSLVTIVSGKMMTALKESSKLLLHSIPPSYSGKEDGIVFQCKYTLIGDMLLLLTCVLVSHFS